MKRTEHQERQVQHGYIRLVALDLDDTVLRPDDKQVSERTARAIRKTAVQGRHVVLASARPLRSIASYAEQLGLEGYCIALNGAVIAKIPEVEPVRVRRLEPHFVRRILALCEELQPDNFFLEFSIGFAARFDGEDVAIYKEMSADEPVHIGDLMGLDHSDVCKVTFRVQDTPFPMLERLSAILGDEASFVVWEGPWSFVEVLPFGTSKAQALEWLCGELGVQQHEVLAVGDQRNDIEMLSWAGIGVAMGNAHPEVKAVADYITDSVDEDGCAAAIERFAHVPLEDEAHG